MSSELIQCLESDLNIKNKVSFVNSLVSLQGFVLEKENDIELWKSKVKEFCCDADKRAEGILLLYAIVHSSATVYVDNWCQIVLGSLKCTDSVIPREIPLKVLNRVVINFGSNSGYSDIFSKVMPEIFPFLLKSDEVKVYVLSLQSLAVCMKYIPTITASYLVDIEKLLLAELDNPYGKITEAIGECFASYPLCLLHAKRTQLEYKDIWCNVFMRHLNTTNLLLNKILKLTDDQEQYVEISGPVFDIPALKSNIPVSQIDAFKSICTCLAKMMSSLDCLIHLPLEELLQSFLRIFDVVKIVKGQNQDASKGFIKFGFSQLLNGIYVVLEALIVNLNVIDQSHNFLAIFNMSLNALDETFSRTSVSQVRGSTWKLINVWLKQYGTKGSEKLANNESILAEILTDIDIEEKLSVESKKQLETIYLEEKNQNPNKVFVCTYALKVLKSLFETSDCFMEKKYLDKICGTLIRISQIVLLHRPPKGNFPFPYSDERNRKALFDVLLTCAVYSDELPHKYIVEILSILKTASRDTSRKVGRICHRFRKLNRNNLNPRKPPADALQDSQPKFLNDQQPVIESVQGQWDDKSVWNNFNVPSSDDQMDEGEVSQVQGENAYSDKMESESDLMPIEQLEETESHMNHNYRRIAKQSSQSMGEEESIDDSDIEHTYISTDSNPQRIRLNDSSRINSFEMQSCAEQYTNETRTERYMSETGVHNMTNNVENNIEEHVSAFVEVKSAAQKSPQAPMGNGEWRKKETSVESEEDDSDMEEECDEEAEANEEVSDNAADEASDGKHSPEFDEERPMKRRKMDEVDEDVDEEVEDEEIPVNNQSSDEEGNEVNNVPVLEQNAGSNSGNLNDEESQDDNEDTGCRSPTIKEMCGDFVLAEPAATEIS